MIALNLLGIGEFRDLVEVHNEDVPLHDAKGLPFDTVFHPERPNETRARFYHRRR